jgi:hypothetical protein
MPLYLQPLSDSLQHVGNDGIVPQICEPHSGSLHIHGTRQEEAGPWEEERQIYVNKTSLSFHRTFNLVPYIYSLLTNLKYPIEKYVFIQV